jgi:ankyrin repeat protein
MKWVFLAWRPLTSAEMEHAVSIEHGSDDIDLDDIVSAKTLASLCAGLVVIDQYGDFRFAHQTVPEYLKASHPDQFYDTDTSVVDGCLTYLLYTTFTSGPCADLAAYQDRTSRYPLYSYCSRYWYKQQNGTLNAEQKQLALQFFRSEPLWRSSRQAARSRVIEHGDILPPQLLWGDTMLHHAAYLDAHHLFEDLLEEDPLALNGRNEMGRTPLMRAAVHGSLGFASKLIQAGAEINVLDVDGDAALHLAVWKENLAMVNLLVTSPSVDINLRTAKTKNGPGGGTALTHAAGNGASAIVERLIEAGADVNAFNNAGYSALHMAAIRGHPQTVEILLAATQININGLTRAGGVRASGASALMLAAEFGHADVVKNFLKAGADAMIAYRNGDAAIHVAVISGHVAVVEALLEFNVEIDTLRKSPEFEHDGFSPLMLATLDGSVQMLKILLTSGRLNVNLQSSKGKSALMIAVKARQIKAAKLLLAHEMIDVDVADDDGWTPLMVAADIGLIEIIPELIAKGANVNAQSKSGWTPILLAAEGNHTAVVEVLSISDSIVLNTPETSQGRTALHYAIGWANAPLVKLLLSEGADLQIRDKTNHFKAIDYARYFKDKGILDLLEASGEKGTT